MMFQIKSVELDEKNIHFCNIKNSFEEVADTTYCMNLLMKLPTSQQAITTHTPSFEFLVIVLTSCNLIHYDRA